MLRGKIYDYFIPYIYVTHKREVTFVPQCVPTCVGSCFTSLLNFRIRIVNIMEAELPHSFSLARVM